jgi:hypothetical protein
MGDKMVGNRVENFVYSRPVIVIGILCVQGQLIGITETNDDKGAQDISKAIKTPCIKDVCFCYFLFLPRGMMHLNMRNSSPCRE